jgi:hypothetical protein
MGPSQEIGVLSCIVQKVTAWGWYRLLESGAKYWNLATIVQGAKKELGNVSCHAEWPKVADAVIKAPFSLAAGGLAWWTI